jgi:RNase P subunit RPR2
LYRISDNGKNVGCTFYLDKRWYILLTKNLSGREKCPKKIERIFCSKCKGYNFSLENLWGMCSRVGVSTRFFTILPLSEYSVFGPKIKPSFFADG